MGYKTQIGPLISSRVAAQGALLLARQGVAQAVEG
jgi:hypothetical protein